MIFWDLINNNQAINNAERFQFMMISGDFPKTGIALPFGNRKVRAAALRELYLYKGRFFWNKVKIGLLQSFNFPFVWNLVFKKKKFGMDFNSAGESFLPFLVSKIGSAEPIVFSAYIGSRKFILPILGVKSGKLFGVAKVYFPGRESFNYGENETKVLNYLKNIHLTDFIFPKILAEDYFRESLVVILSSPRNLKNITSVTEHHTDFLKQLSEKTSRKSTFLSSNFYEEIQKEIEFLKSKKPDKSDLVKYFYKQSLQNLRNKEFIFSLTKREFPFFEMMKAGSKFFVIDWEQARFGFPPIFDLFSLLMSSGKFKKGDYVEFYRKNLIDLFFQKNKKSQRIVQEMLHFWELNQSDAYWFFWLYVLDQLYIHLHVDHYLSAERLFVFLENVRNNESWFRKNWLGVGI